MKKQRDSLIPNVSSFDRNRLEHALTENSILYFQRLLTFLCFVLVFRYRSHRRIALGILKSS